MRLPEMKYTDGIRKMRQIQFGGINRTEGAKDGELFDMKNMTSDHYPILASRGKRCIYWKPEPEMDDPVPRGLYAWDKLAWIIDNDVYYDGKKVATMLKGHYGQQSMAAIGKYIVMMPDGFVFNTETEELKYIGTGGMAGNAVFKDGTLNGEQAKANSLYMRFVDWAGIGLRPGDAVSIEGCEVEPRNNKSAIIRQIDGDTLRFDENTFRIPDGASEYTDYVDSEDKAITVSRKCPEMEFITECDNRIWGCAGDRIYASKLGDPFNFNVFDGLETDSWSAETGTAGRFTGAITYQGRPYFFKENMIVKIYGSTPSGFGFSKSADIGVAEGSSGSLAVADEVLFYLSNVGVMAYTGGVPKCISGNFGKCRFLNGRGGSDGKKYYLSVTEERKGYTYIDEDGTEVYTGTSDHRIYVYDVQRGIWCSETMDGIAYSAMLKGNLYILDDSANIWMNEVYNEHGKTMEPEIQWEAEFADFVEDVSSAWMKIGADKKAVNRIQIRMELGKTAWAEIYIQYDSDGNWVKLARMEATEAKRSFCIPVTPRRADHYRLKLKGQGGVKIYSVAREYYSGSER